MTYGRIATLVCLPSAFSLAAGCDDRVAGRAAPRQESPVVSDGIERSDLRFRCAESECAAWLYRPLAGPKPPIVVMAHGFGGTRDVGLPFFAERFARAGIAALVFDYRYFGASGGAPRQLVDPWSQMDDWRAAVSFARTLADVDPARVALWGTSLGAGLALVVAAEDDAVRALVAQAPLIDTDREGEATYYGASWVVRLLVNAWHDLGSTALGGPSITVLAISRGGGFGMIVDDAAYSAFERIVPRDSTYRNEVAARSLVTFDDYNPEPKIPKLHARTLLIASRRDRFASFAAVEAAAEANRLIEVQTFEGDHFDIYSSPARELAADAAAAFLRKALEVPG